MFQQACRDAGVPVIRLHALRHTCVTLLLNLGVPPRVVMEIVGHSTLEMTMNVYAHVSLDAQREAMAKLNELFTGTPTNPDEPTDTDPSHHRGTAG
jgi:integrase